MTADEKIRIDKWLWAARFFKTRSQAAEAVAGGKVHVAGGRVKPARLIGVGEEVRVQKGPYAFVVTVLELASRRLSAPEAQQLYSESEQSREGREAVREERRLRREAGIVPPPTRPGKRDRRLIKKFIRKD
ncbi:MAG: RNA-binding S4 domain-containing protein [Thermodesulfobacteriota bacterium]